MKKEKLKKNKTKNKSTLKDKLINKDKEIIQLNEELGISKQKNIKLLAEFDNFQRRTIEEKEKMRKYEGLEIIKDLLNTFDDLDRTERYKDSEDTKSNKSIQEAIQMINSKKKNILDKYLIQSFESINMKFDPNLHEALLEQHSNEIKKGDIIEEYEKGYKYKDKIIRHAKVVVSKGQEK